MKSMIYSMFPTQAEVQSLPEHHDKRCAFPQIKYRYIRYFFFFSCLTKLILATATLWGALLFKLEVVDEPVCVPTCDIDSLYWR